MSGNNVESQQPSLKVQLLETSAMTTDHINCLLGYGVYPYIWFMDSINHPYVCLILRKEKLYCIFTYEFSGNNFLVSPYLFICRLIFSIFASIHWWLTCLYATNYHTCIYFLMFEFKVELGGNAGFCFCK